YADGSIRLFDKLSGKQYGSFKLPTGEGLHWKGKFTLSSDGRHACVLSDRAVYLLRLPDPPERAKADEVWRFDGHVSNVLGVDFSPDGNWVISSSSDGTVRLFDARTGKLLKSMPHRNARSVAFLPDGKRAISTGDTGESHVRLWDLDTGKEIKD